MAQPDDMSEQSDPYGKIADEALAARKPGPSDEDCDAIVAAIVQRLKKESPLPEGASEEPLYDMARKIYWDYKDSKRDGKDELTDTSPESIM